MMDNLVSRQAAIDGLSKLRPRMIDTYEKDGDTFLKVRAYDVNDMLEGLPSAQPEIIRCKECKKAPKCYGDVIMKSKGGGYIYCPVEYCSEAERRTNERA